MAGARVATVRVVCAPTRGQLVIAAVAPSVTGDLTLRLDGSSPLVVRLAQGHALTVTLAAPAPFSSLVAVGRARHLPDDGDSAWTFAVEVAGLMLQGPLGRVQVAVDDFWAVEDDPLAPEAPRVLAHLNDAHADELTACVRAHVEPRAEWVLPRSLDRFGLGLAVMTPDGISDVVLGFPNAPVSSMREVASSLRVALTCPCQSRHIGGDHDHADG